MHRIPRLILLAATAGALAACQGGDQSSGEAASRALVGTPQGPVELTVNGEAVTSPLVETFARGRGMDPTDPAQREKAQELLIENLLLAQDTLAGELGQRPEVQAEAALARLLQLAGRGLAAQRSAIEITDAQLLDYYESERVRTGGVEYHVAHLLFDDRAAAEAALERARAPGADVDALIAEYAAGGARQARDLGWAHLAQMPDEFAEVLAQLQDGEVAPVPVETTFGWHVVQRRASRPFNPPPFEEVKDGARRQLVERALADKVKALRDTARIERPGR